ncbi:MAG: hypothetical protein ABII75_03875 [Candidatus Omnitrophota bacterium]
MNRLYYRICSGVVCGMLITGQPVFAGQINIPEQSKSTLAPSININSPAFQAIIGSGWMTELQNKAGDSNSENQKLAQLKRTIEKKSDLTAYARISKVFRESKNIRHDFEQLIASGALVRAIPFYKDLNLNPTIEFDSTENKKGRIEDHWIVVFLNFLSIYENNREDFHREARSPEAISPDIFENYHRILKHIIKTEEDREFYFLVTLAHDIGEHISKPNHPAASAELIRTVLKTYMPDITESRIKQAEHFLRSHVDIGTMYTGERTVNNLRKGLERYSSNKEEQTSLLNWLIAFTLADMRGVGNGFLIDDFIAGYYLGVRERINNAGEEKTVQQIQTLAAPYKSDKYLHSRITKLAALPNPEGKDLARLKVLQRLNNKLQEAQRVYEGLDAGMQEFIGRYLSQVDVLNYGKAPLRYFTKEELRGFASADDADFDVFMKLIMVTAYAVRLSEEKYGEAYTWVDYLYPGKTQFELYDAFIEQCRLVPPVNGLTPEDLGELFNRQNNDLFGLRISFDEENNKIKIDFAPLAEKEASAKRIEAELSEISGDKLSGRHLNILPLTALESAI